MSTLLQTGSLFSASVAVAEGKQIRALCAYEGSFTSMAGTKRKFTPKMLAGIVAASNAHLISGVQVPVYYSNHDYDPQDKVGLIEGPFEGKVITETDLPDPNLTDLIGKYGIFTTIRLIRDEAIADYDAKLIKPISMSIDFDGIHFTKDAIYEISLVGFSAIPGAQLFSKGTAAMKPNFKAMAQQAFELQQQYGLTLNDKIAQEQLMPNLFRLFDAFTSLIREIYESEEEDNKEQLIQNAISDLSIGIASRLKLNAPGLTQLSLDPDDQNPDEDPDETPDEDEENMAELEELRSQVTELQQTQQLQEAYSALHARAGELVESGYLTPALYTSDFKAASFSAKDIVAKFGGQTLGAALATIQEKTIELNALEKFGKPVRMGTFVHEPLEQTNQADAEAEAFMSSYSIKTPLGQY